MRITRSQKQALGAPQRERFIQEMIVLLRKGHAVWSEADEAPIRAFVNTSIKWARDYGLTSDSAVKKFIDCRAEFALEPPLEECYHVILNDVETTEIRRVEAFYLALASGLGDLKEVETLHLW